MFKYRRSIYRLALSPRDKRRKRELQFEQKFKDVLENEGGYEYEDWSRDDLIDHTIESEKEAYEGLGDGIVDPEDLNDAQSEKVHELVDEHFWTVYTEELIKKAAEQYVSPELDHRFTQAHEAYEKAVKEYGSGSSTVERLESELDSIETEWNEAVRKEGDAYESARTDLENEHWAEHYNEIVNTLFKTESVVQKFLEARYAELQALSNGGSVWRGVVMESGKDPRTNLVLGKWWTDKQDLARPFLKEMRKETGWHDPVVIRYHARVDDLSQRVNLLATLEANAWAYIHNGYDTDRHEVQFYQYAPVYVYEAELLDTDPYSPEHGANVVETFPIEEMRRC